MKRELVYLIALSATALSAIDERHASSVTHTTQSVMEDDAFARSIVGEKQYDHLEVEAQNLVERLGQETLTYLTWLGAQGIYYLSLSGILHAAYARKYGHGGTASTAAVSASMLDAAQHLFQGDSLGALNSSAQQSLIRHLRTQNVLPKE